MKSQQAEQQTAAVESIELARSNAEQQLAATLSALESSNNKIAELESLLANRDDQAAELGRVLAKNSELEEELTAVRSKLAETVDCVEKLNQECSQLKEVEINRSSSAEKMVRELQESLDAMKQQLSIVEDEKLSATDQLEHVQQLLSDSVDKYSSLSDAHALLQSDFEGTKRAFDQLNQNQLCSNEHTAAVIEECTVLKDTIENLTVQRDMVLAEKQAACEEMASLKESLNGSIQQYEELKVRQDILYRGVVELNCAVCGRTLASPVDCASLLSFSESDIQHLFSKIHSEVADLQSKLELHAKQAEDECRLREKVENDKAVLLQEADAMCASIQSLQEEHTQLSSTVKQLESSQAELSVRCSAYESQVVQLQTELEAARTSQDAAEQVEETSHCPDMTLLQKAVDEKDAEIERLHQEIRECKLHMEQERERHTVEKEPLQALGLCTYESENVESKNCEVDDSVTAQQLDFDTDIDENSRRDVVGENQASVTAVELLTEDQASATELSEMKEKMAEWEAMMLMLQTERDEIQTELRKLEQQQKQMFGTVDEVLQCVLNSMKGRDLFPSSSETIAGSDGSDGELWNKLALLKTVVDELVFEMDEMKEQIHHLTDEAKVSEQRVLELEAESKKLKEEAEEKSVQLQNLRELEDALKKRELELSAENEQMKTSLSEIASDLNDKDALVEKLKVLGSDADRQNTELELLRSEVASKDQLLSDAKVSEETLQQSLKEVNEQLRCLELHLSSVESKHSVEIAELQAERDKFSTRIQELQKESDVMHEQSSSVAHDLQRQYNDKCSEATELCKTITTYSNQIEELQKRLKVEVSEKEELKLEHTKLADVLKDLERHLDQLRAETSDLNAAKITFEQKLCSLQEESEQKVKLSESQISQLEASLSAIQTDYEKTCERKSVVENELVDCSKQLELTSSRLSHAEDQCSWQADELLQVRSELEQLKENCHIQAVEKSASCDSMERVQKSSSGDVPETTADSVTAQVSVFVSMHLYE